MVMCTVAVFTAEPLLTPNNAAITLSTTGGQVQIAYTGILQAAEQLPGTWQLNSSGRAKRRYFFFRRNRPLQHTRTASRTFRSSLRRTARRDFPTGLEAWFTGEITIGQQTVPVDFRVRGNSSLQECPFPKLKFKVSRTDRVEHRFSMRAK